MNNTFNIKRFGFTFRKDLIENGKQYVLLLLTMFGLMALVITFQTLNHYAISKNADNHLSLNRILLIYLSFMFLGFGTWFASTFSSPMNHKLKRLSYLISPASNLEKYLVRWIITTIGFIFAFFATMWFADALRVAIGSVVYPDLDIRFIDITQLFAPDGRNTGISYVVVPKEVFTILLSIYFLLQSIFLLGSTFWEKATFLKTFTAVAAIVAAFILICRWAILFFYGSLIGFGKVLDSFQLDQTFSTEQVIIVISAFTLTFWILAYFRMKESEIIKRL